MDKQSDKMTLESKSQKNDRNARLRTILQEFREHPNHHASPALVAALIELETELDANSVEPDQSDVCFQRSAHLMPRLQIVTELQTFVIPWHAVSLIQSDPSKKIIELFTTFGLHFKICSQQKLDDLLALLQLERVKIIYPIEGVTVNVHKENDV